eukprot:1656478-Alexandrium_andersonii.AAC.1
MRAVPPEAATERRLARPETPHLPQLGPAVHTGPSQSPSSSGSGPPSPRPAARAIAAAATAG